MKVKYSVGFSTSACLIAWCLYALTYYLGYGDKIAYLVAVASFLTSDPIVVREK